MKNKIIFIISLIIICLLIVACGNKDLKDKTEEVINNIKELQVEMKTKEGKYNLPIDKIIIDIKNNGNKDVVYGASYSIEEYKDQRWEQIPFKDGVAFIEIAYVLQPGIGKEEIINLDNLEKKITKGKYRIIKEFYIDDKKENIKCEFTVE